MIDNPASLLDTVDLVSSIRSAAHRPRTPADGNRTEPGGDTQR